MAKFRDYIADLVTNGDYTGARREAAGNAWLAGRLRESMEEFEAEQRAAGWQTTGEAVGFKREDLRRISRDARYCYFKNPLINRGVNVQADYVFGQGLEITVADQDAQDVLDEFRADIRNRTVLTDITALLCREAELAIDGNLFFALYTDSEGYVSVRVLDSEQFEDVIRNPDDGEDAWYYKRIYTREQLNLTTGNIDSKTTTVYHPDWNYRPADMPAKIGGHEVLWEAPVYHMAPSALFGAKFGICEFYAGTAWAKSYTRFLENRATVASALAKFSLKATTKLKKGVTSLRETIAERIGTRGSRAGNAVPSATEADADNGQLAAMGPGRDIEAVSVKGATINPEEGRRLALMSHAAFGFPETFWGDVSVGTLATATAVDRPTEFKIVRRQCVWGTALRDICTYVLIKASEAGRIQAAVEWRGPNPILRSGADVITVEVKWPPVLEHAMAETVTAIEKAASHVPLPRLIAQLMLGALGVKDAKKQLEGVTDVQFAELHATAQKNSSQADPAAQKNSDPNPGAQK